MQIYELWEGLLVRGFIISPLDCLGVRVNKILLYLNYKRKREVNDFKFENIYFVFMQR